ncbi:MAG: hypothetical protein LBK44_01715, partial [Spirochaetales bacterium]|nr:hypothetical protein [Spirochaetales bacterium]
PCVIRNLGAFPALRAGNRAFRSKSSEAPMRFLWAFRYNPWRGRAAAQDLLKPECRIRSKPDSHIINKK